MLAFSPKRDSPAITSEKFNKLIVRQGAEETLIRLLKSVAPKLDKLRYAKITAEPLVYAGTDLPLLIPTSQMGQAFNRLLNLYMDLLSTGTKVLLIDEIENGLHYTVYDEVWKGITQLAVQENVQIFVTTHNRDCLVAAMQASIAIDKDIFFHHRFTANHDLESSPDIKMQP